MGFRWLVNAVLLALPIGTTIGVLLGVDSHRQATGQKPLFNGGNGSGIGGSIGGGSSNGGSSNGGSSNGGGSNGGGSNGGSSNDNGITDTLYCQKEVGISPPSKGVQYTLNPNQWGWTEGEPGAMCMNITAFHNNTYATIATAPKFSVTWQYPPGPETQPVHAFPNAQIDSGVLPIELPSLQHINLEMQWTYGAGNEAAASTNVEELTQNLVNTNVAVDMFLDSDKSNSQNSSKAGYEVMVWFAAFGAAAQPIGLKEGVVTTQILNSTTFNLYTGKNGLEQSVLTWVASETTEVFSGDIAPLLTGLSAIAGADFPAASLFLGHLGIGSEAFSANVNVTFNMPVLSIDLEA